MTFNYPITISSSSDLEERVFAIPRFELESLPDCGFKADQFLFRQIIGRGMFLYPRRSLAEKHEHLKHVAVYVLVWCYVEGEIHYLAYQRGQKGQGEDRLASLWSIGVGGHVNIGDTAHPCGDQIRAAAARELAEEVPNLRLEATPGDHLNFLGVINDDSNPVGRVHLGALYSVEVKPPDDAEIKPGLPIPYADPDCQLRKPGFVSLQRLRDHFRGSLESWSEIVLKSIENGEIGEI